MINNKINAILQNLSNIELQVGEAAGIATLVEIKMRLIGELHKPINNKLKHLTCKLKILAKEITREFQDKLNLDEKTKIETFSDIRNKVAHGDIINLLTLLGIPPTSQKIIPGQANSNLAIPSILESINVVARGGAFNTFRSQAQEVNNILNQLLRGLANG